jgi:hypothetical protein
MRRKEVKAGLCWWPSPSHKCTQKPPSCRLNKMLSISGFQRLVVVTKVELQSESLNWRYRLREQD